jgi:hypothetical protein
MSSLTFGWIILSMCLIGSARLVWTSVPDNVRRELTFRWLHRRQIKRLNVPDTLTVDVIRELWGIEEKTR